MPVIRSDCYYDVKDVSAGYADVTVQIGGFYENTTTGINGYFGNGGRYTFKVPVTTTENTSFSDARAISLKQVPIFLNEIFNMKFTEGLPF